MLVQTLYVNDGKQAYIEVSAVNVRNNYRGKRAVGYTVVLDLFEDEPADLSKPWKIDMDYNEFTMTTEDGESEIIKINNMYELDFSEYPEEFRDTDELCKHYVETMMLSLNIVAEALNH